MKVSQWAEIRRLVEVEKLSQRAVAQRLRCCFRTVAKALSMDHPPDEKRSAPRGSLLDPYKPKIDALLARYPQLSAARVMEEIRRGPDGYQGKLTLVRIYIRKVRPRRGRVYQEVEYEPGQAMQIDWGHCGQIRIGSTQRKVSVFVAVLCYSRLCYIEFPLSQRKAEFYRAIMNALTYFGGSPRRIIFDNLKAAVLNGSGRSACLHPEFLALCGHFCLEPIACERRDPESKGTVDRNQLISLPEHRLEALKLRSRVRAHDIEEAFDSLGDEARKFHLELRRQPVKTTVHLRRLLNLVHLYGRQDVVAAIARANQWLTFDAAYVETILLQDRRRRELPSPTQVRPRREELLEETDLEEPDPADYDRLIQSDEETDHE